MRCRHPKQRRERYVWRVGGGDVMTWFDCASFETPDLEACAACNEYLSLGPANDAGCAIEIRAAEIAAAGHAGRCSMKNMEWDCERCGWEHFGVNHVEGTPRWHAGYLARCIVDHNTLHTALGERGEG